MLRLNPVRGCRKVYKKCYGYVPGGGAKRHIRVAVMSREGYAERHKSVRVMSRESLPKGI